MRRVSASLVAALLALPAAACGSSSDNASGGSGETQSSGSSANHTAGSTLQQANFGQLTATGAVSGSVHLSRVQCAAGNGGAFITWSGDLGSSSVVGEIQATGTGTLAVSPSSANRVTLTEGASATSGTVYTSSAPGGTGTLTLASNNSGSMQVTLAGPGGAGDLLQLSGTWNCA